MKLPFLLLFILLCTFIVPADRLILQGDRELEGVVIKEEQEYRIITPHSIITIHKDRVKEVYQESDHLTSIEKTVERLQEQEQYRQALQLLERCLEENILGIAEYYHHYNDIQRLKNIEEFEIKLQALHQHEKYHEIIDVFHHHQNTYPDYELSDSQQEKLIKAYTQRSFYYIDHIQYEKGYQYLHKAFQLCEDSQAVQDILTLYAERTGKEAILKREKEHKEKEEYIVDSEPVVTPITPPEKEPPAEEVPEDEESYKEEIMTLMLQAYNAGPATLLAYEGNVRYRETQEFIKRVKKNLDSSDLSTPHDDLIYQYAEKYQLDPQFVKAVLMAESSGQTRAVSSQGARGLMQIMRDTWHDMTGYIDVQWTYQQAFDPAKNIEIGCAYFAWLRDDFLPLFFSFP